MTPERIAELRGECKDLIDAGCACAECSFVTTSIPELLAEIKRMRDGLQYIADKNTHCDDWGIHNCSNYAQKILDGGAK